MHCVLNYTISLIEYIKVLRVFCMPCAINNITMTVLLITVVYIITVLNSIHHFLTPCLNVIITSLMLSKKDGYHKTYLPSTIILKDLVSRLSDTGDFVINIWGSSGHLLDFYKTCCVCRTYYYVVYDLWPQIFCISAVWKYLSHKWMIAVMCIV